MGCHRLEGGDFKSPRWFLGSIHRFIHVGVQWFGFAYRDLQGYYDGILVVDLRGDWFGYGGKGGNSMGVGRDWG